MRIAKCRFGQREHFETMAGFVYCGRKFGGFERSPLANSYRGAGAVQRYREWLRLRIEVGDPAVLAALDALTPDSVLGCWCVDKEAPAQGGIQCHAEIIAEEWARHQTTRKVSESC